MEWSSLGTGRGGEGSTGGVGLHVVVGMRLLQSGGEVGAHSTDEVEGGGRAVVLCLM